MNKNINFEKYFKGKKITLMGLGGLGRGVAEAEFLIRYGADLIITDLAKEEDLQKEIKRVKEAQEKYKNNGAKVSFSLGGQKIEDFKNRDVVFSANGVPLGNEYIEAAKKYSKITTKSIAFVFWIIKQETEKITTIGVTGAKGKSTTTALIEYLLKTDEKKVYSGGNLRAASNLPILEKIQEGDFLLAELDSWLLQGFGNQKISPDIAVFTNFFNDHQNYYHSMEKYFLDKSYIFQFQKENNFLVLNSQSEKEINKYFKGEILSKKIIADSSKNPDWNYPIFGEHNKENIAQALEVAKILGISEENQKKAMETFPVVDGRFQYLGEKKGIYFYNDNNATNPASSIISLESLRKKYPDGKVYLIAGGADKDFDFKAFSESIEKNSEFVVLFAGNGTDKIISFFSESFKKYQIVDTMKNAVDVLLKKAGQGDVIVLSPGAASFGCFKNEYDRNDQFVKEFQEI